MSKELTAAITVSVSSFANGAQTEQARALIKTSSPTALYVRRRKFRRLLLVRARTRRRDISRANVFNVLTATRNRFRPRRVRVDAERAREGTKRPSSPSSSPSSVERIRYRQVRVTSPSSRRYLKVTESRTGRERRDVADNVDLDNNDNERVSK